MLNRLLILLAVLLSGYAYPRICNIPLGRFSVEAQYQIIHNVRVSSLIHLNKNLVAAAREMAKDATAQKEINRLLKQEIDGGDQRTGSARKVLGNGYVELRAMGSQARLFIKRIEGTDGRPHIVIVGKATHANEDYVFNQMRNTFHDFPKLPARVNRPRQK